MLEAIRDDMLTALSSTGAFLQVDVWKGDMEALLSQPKRCPAAFVCLAVGTFDPVKTIPPGCAKLGMEWDVVLFFNSLGKGADVAARGYGLIETVCARASSGGLTGLKTSGGMLWPKDLELVSVTPGVTAYRIGFGINAEIS